MEDKVETKPAVVETKQPSKDEITLAINLLYSGDDTIKKDFLSYRYSGFSRKESMEFTGVDDLTFWEWKQVDPEFKTAEEIISRVHIEANGREKLRQEVLRHIFARNMRLALEHDYRVFSKAMFGEEPLTTGEMAYLASVRKYYTAGELKVMENLLNGETSGVGNIVGIILGRTR